MLSLQGLIVLLLRMTASHFIFYDTNYLQHDCLYYSLHSTDIAQIIQYCLRPIHESNSMRLDFINTRDQNFTFHTLHRLNVTTKELLLWSASINVAERYQYYIDQQKNSLESHEIFFNCTKPWFGSRCQYSLELNETTIETKWKYESTQ